MTPAILRNNYTKNDRLQYIPNIVLFLLCALLTPMHVKHTILHVQPVFMRMNPRDSKYVGGIRN